MAKGISGITVIFILLVVGGAIAIGNTPQFQNWMGSFTPGACVVDDTWYIMYNHDDSYDTWGARLIRDEYGATMVPLDNAMEDQYNKQGQNLLFIGGSKKFAGKVPWMETWPTLTVIKPGGFPDVYIDTDGTWDNIWIHTPLGDYQSQEDGVQVADYGVIARGWDSDLQRWIVVVIGHTASGTGAGAVICVDNWEAVVKGKWLVYEIDPIIWAENQDVSEWNKELFSEPNLVAYG